MKKITLINPKGTVKKIKKGPMVGPKRELEQPPVRKVAKVTGVMPKKKVRVKKVKKVM